MRVVHVAGATALRDLDLGIALLRDAGLRIRRDPTLGLSTGYLAGSDEERAGDLRRAMEEQGCGAILCARGGWGSLRILESAEQSGFPTSHQWLVGYSDITALHLAANQAGVATIHGPMVAGLGRYDDQGLTVHELVATLRSGKPRAWEGLESWERGVAEGTLVGGNLSIVSAMIGTRWLPDLSGRIVFLEEVSEPLYRVDRMLTLLRVSGRAAGIAGIVLGDFTRCGSDPAELSSALRRWTSEFGCPVVAGLPCGHGSRNLPLVLGLRYQLDAAAGTLRAVVSSSLSPSREACMHASREGESEGSVALCTPLGRVEVPATHASREGSDTPDSPLSAHYRDVVYPVRRASCSGPVTKLIRQGLEQGIFSGIQVHAMTADHRRIAIADGVTGTIGIEEPELITSGTSFDLASLTKPLCTTVLAFRALERGDVTLSTPIPSHLSSSQATFGQLLSHRSGLPAYHRLWDRLRAEVEPAAYEVELRRRYRELNSSNERQCAYSDVGFMLLGWWLEELYAAPLDEAFEELSQTVQLPGPLGFRRLSRSDGTDIGQVAATEFCPWRSEILQGIVHDEHAQLVDGVAGHAGLFGTADAVATWCESLLRGEILSAASLATMWDRRLLEDGFTWLYGWDTMSGSRSTAGSLMDRKTSVGHLGFTGTSVWLDPRRHRVVVVLTNRVHPSRNESHIRSFRPQFHDALLRALGS